MDEEIVLDRGSASVLKLDDDEQAIMDEIHISAPRMQPVRRPTTQRPKPQPQRMHQEEIDAFANPSKQSAPPRPPAEEVDYGEDEQQFFDDDYEDGGMQQEEQPSAGFSSIDDEKSDLLNKLTRLEKRGHAVNKRLNAYSNIDELRAEVKRITYSIEVDQSVRFSKRMLIACVTGLEFLNKRYNPFDLYLDGWSESVMENQDDYDTVFEELYAKYRTKVNVAPEIKLILMIGGSATMFHLTNSMFKAALPNMNDVIKQNPSLVQNMMDAVKNTTVNAPASSDDTPSSDGPYQMQGPGIDISSLMGAINMPPPPPMNTTPQTMTAPAPPPAQEDDNISDIVSVSGDSTGGEVKEVTVSGPAKRTRRKKKNEINL